MRKVKWMNTSKSLRLLSHLSLNTLTTSRLAQITLAQASTRWEARARGFLYFFTVRWHDLIIITTEVNDASK